MKLRKTSIFKKFTAFFLTLLMLVSVMPMANVADFVASAMNVENPKNIFASDDARVDMNFNKNWKFHLGDDVADSQLIDTSDETWRDIDLPHDFSIEQEFTTSGTEVESGLLPGGTGWYRKTFTLPTALEGKRLILTFDGAYKDTTVYVNGTEIGQNHYGYNSFSFDITNYVYYANGNHVDRATGQMTTSNSNNINLIAVKVSNQIPSSRWYSGSGINRDVTLTAVDPVHVSLNGTQVTTASNKTDGTATTSITLENDGSTTANVTVKAQVLNLDGTANGSQVSTTKSINAYTSDTVTLAPVASSFKMWDIYEGNQYLVRTQLFVNGNLVDQYDTKFGYRYFDWSTSNGFSINGRNVKVQGVCIHQDNGALGNVQNYDAIYRQVSILKDMGVNAIRTSHNISSSVYLDVCAELGMLVLDEFYDGWFAEKNGNTHDFHEYFSAQVSATNPTINLIGATSSMSWAEYTCKEAVKRDRNNPSVFMWDIGNELENEFNNSDNWGTNLCSWIRANDAAGRKITWGNNKGEPKTIDTVSGGCDVLGGNYHSGSWANVHNGYIFIASESVSAVSSRGYYKASSSNTGNNNVKYVNTTEKQIDSYDGSFVSWGDSASHGLYQTLANDWWSGQFVWTGFDYIGEPTPWNGTGSATDINNPNSSYFGIVDTAGFAKDSYYLYRSIWNKTSNTLHLVPGSWDTSNMLQIGGYVPVAVYSNANHVKLFLNGEEIANATATVNKSGQAGEYKTWTETIINSSKCNNSEIQEFNTATSANDHDLYPQFRVKYEAGTLEVKAYSDAAGTQEITNTVGTTSVTSDLDYSAPYVQAKVWENSEFVADGETYAYVEYTAMTEKDGEFLPNCNDEISVSLSGSTADCEIAGVDNGDASTRNKFQSESVLSADRQQATIKLFNGKAIVIVRVKNTDKSGVVRLAQQRGTTNNITIQGATVKVAADTVMDEFEEYCPQEIVEKETTVSDEKDKTQAEFDAIEAPVKEEEEETASYTYEKYTPATSGQFVEADEYVIRARHNGDQKNPLVLAEKYDDTALKTTLDYTISDNVITLGTAVANANWKFEVANASNNTYYISCMVNGVRYYLAFSSGAATVTTTQTACKIYTNSTYSGYCVIGHESSAYTTNTSKSGSNYTMKAWTNTDLSDANSKVELYKKVKQKTYSYNKYTPTGTGTGETTKTITVNVTEDLKFAYPGINTTHNGSYYSNTFTTDSRLKENLSSYLWNFNIISSDDSKKVCEISAPSINTATHETVYMDLNYRIADAGCPVYANAKDKDNYYKEYQIHVYYNNGKGFNFCVQDGGAKRLEFNHGGSEYTFNLITSGDCPDNCHYRLFRQATSGETSSTLIPGYVEITSLNSITANGKYLIVAQSGGAYYLLRPADAFIEYGHAAEQMHHYNFVAKLGNPETTVTGTRQETETTYRQYIADGTYIIAWTNHDGASATYATPVALTGTEKTSGSYHFIQANNNITIVNDGNVLTGTGLDTCEYDIKFNENDGTYRLKNVSTGKYVCINGNSNVTFTTDENAANAQLKAICNDGGIVAFAKNGCNFDYYSTEGYHFGAWTGGITGTNIEVNNKKMTLFAKTENGESEEAVTTTGKEVYSFYNAKASVTQTVPAQTKTYYYVEDGTYEIYWFPYNLSYHGTLKAHAPGEETETAWTITKESDDPTDDFYTISTQFPAGGDLYYLGFDSTGMIMSKNRHVVQIEAIHNDNETYNYKIGNKAGTLWLVANGKSITYTANEADATPIYLSQGTPTGEYATVNGTTKYRKGTQLPFDVSQLEDGGKYYFYNSYQQRYLTADGTSVKTTTGCDPEKSLWTLEKTGSSWNLKSYDGKYITYGDYNGTWKTITLTSNPTAFDAQTATRSYFGSYDGFLFFSMVGGTSYEIHDEDKEAWGYAPGIVSGSATDSLWVLSKADEYIEGGSTVEVYRFDDPAVAHSTQVQVPAGTVTTPGISEQYYVIYNILPQNVAPNVIATKAKTLTPYGESTEKTGLDLDTDTFFNGENLLVTSNANEFKFINTSGNDYYVKAQNGKYLAITSAGLMLTTAPTELTVTPLADGRIVLSNGNNSVAHVRNNSTSQTGGYISSELADKENATPEFILSLYADQDNLFYNDTSADELYDTKVKLYEAIQHALTYNVNDYTDESYVPLVSALNAGIATYKDTQATLEALLLAIENIEKAVDGLVPTGARFPGTIFKYGYNSSDSTQYASEGAYPKAGGYDFNLVALEEAKRNILADTEVVASIENLLASNNCNFTDDAAGQALKDAAIVQIAEEYAQLYTLIFTGNGYKGSNTDAQTMYNPGTSYRTTWNWWTKSGTQNPGGYKYPDGSAIGVQESKDEGVSLLGLFSTDISQTGVPTTRLEKAGSAIPYINKEDANKGGVTSNLSITIATSDNSSKSITLVPLEKLNVQVPDLFAQDEIPSRTTSLTTTSANSNTPKSEYAKQYWDFYFPFKEEVSNKTGVSTYVYDAADSSYIFRAAYNDANHTANAVLQDVSNWSIKDGLGDTARGFFPFNYKLDDTSVTSFTGQNAIFHSGVTFSTDFTLPTTPDRKYHARDNATTAAAEDVTFSFRGDDDVLVYIDDVLVLDNGGLHGARDISINFTEKSVTYEYVMDSLTNTLVNKNDVPGVTYKYGDTANNTANGITADVQKALDKLDSIWSDHGTHTLKFYFLERGSTASNCKIKFNLKTITDQIRVDDQQLVADYGLPVEYNLDDNTDATLKANFDKNRAPEDAETGIESTVPVYEADTSATYTRSEDYNITSLNEGGYYVIAGNKLNSTTDSDMRDYVVGDSTTKGVKTVYQENLGVDMSTSLEYIWKWSNGHLQNVGTGKYLQLLDNNTAMVSNESEASNIRAFAFTHTNDGARIAFENTDVTYANRFLHHNGNGGNSDNVTTWVQPSSSVNSTFRVYEVTRSSNDAIGTYTESITTPSTTTITLDSVKRGNTSGQFVTDDQLAKCHFTYQSNGTFMDDRSQHAPGLVIDLERVGFPTRGSNTNIVNGVAKASGTTDKFVLLNNNSRALYFDSSTYKFNAGNVEANTTNSGYHFYIFRQANSGESTTDSLIPGYVKVTALPLSQNVNYIIVHEGNDGKLYALRPYTADSGENNKYLFVDQINTSTTTVPGSTTEIPHPYVLDGTYAITSSLKYLTPFTNVLALSTVMTGWTFEKVNKSDLSDTKYYISTTFNGAPKYLDVTSSGTAWKNAKSECDVTVVNNTVSIGHNGQSLSVRSNEVGTSATGSTFGLVPVTATGANETVNLGSHAYADITYLGVVLGENQRDLPNADNADYYDSSYTNYPFNADNDSYTIEGKYGDLTVDKNGNTKYSLKTMKFDGVETFYVVAKVSNDPNYVYGDYLFIEKLTYIPATSVYYEDDFEAISFVDAGVNDDTFGKWSVVTDATATKADKQAADLVGADGANIYGYDDAYENFATYSNASAHKITVSAKNKNPWPYAEFTFAGTGFDIVSVTNHMSGVFAVSIYKGDNSNGTKVASKMVDTYYGYSYGKLYVGADGKPTHTDAGLGQLYKTTYTSKADVPETEARQTIYFSEGKVFSTIPSYYDDHGNVTREDTGNEAFAYGWIANAAASDTLYQIPVLKITDLEYGTYTVKVEARYTSMFNHNYTLNGNKCYDLYFDAVRIYDPTGPATAVSAAGNTVAGEAYIKDHEAYVNSKEIKDLVIGAETLTTNGNEGIIFIDGNNAIDTDLLADYKSIGPNNELYLSHNQAVVFEIWATQVPTDIQVGAKLAGNLKQATGGVDLQIIYDKAHFDKQVTSATEMYYSFDDILANPSDKVIGADKLTWTPINAANGKTYYRSGAIILRNASANENAVLSVTNIKWTFENYGATGYYKVPDGFSTSQPQLLTVASAPMAARAMSLMAAPHADLAINEESVQVSADKVTSGDSITLNFTTSTDVDTVEITDENGKKFTIDSIESFIEQVEDENVKQWTVTLRPTGDGTYVFEIAGVYENGFATSDKVVTVTVNVDEKVVIVPEEQPTNPDDTDDSEENQDGTQKLNFFQKFFAKIRDFFRKLLRLFGYNMD